MYINYFESKSVYTFLAIVCFVFGFALNFFGYRFYRFAMVATGLFAGAEYSAVLVSAIIDGFETESAYWIAFWVGGVVFGLFAALHVTSGTAISAFVAGAQMTFLILGMASYTGTTALQALLGFVGGVVCATFSMFARKAGLMVATSFVGATLFMDGVSHFVNHKIINDSYDYLYEDIRSAWWAMTGITIGLFVVGIAIQLFLTARGIDYEAAQQQADESGDGHYIQDIRRDEPQFGTVLSPLNNTNSNNKASRYVAANPIAYV